MTQIFNMEPNDVRNLAREYIRQGVTSRAIQCFERLLWLGMLRQREYSQLCTMYTLQEKETNAKTILNRYNNIYK